MDQTFRTLRSVCKTAACLSAVTICGCYAGAALVGLGVAELASGDDSSSAESSPEVLFVAEPVRLNGDLVLVKGVVVNARSNPVDVVFQWRREHQPGDFEDAEE